MLKCLANIILRMGGWKILGEIPSIPQAVFLAAPHTSNWDGFWLLVYKVAIDLDVRFLAKDTLFWWPLSSILRALGAMSLDRDDASGIVLQLVGAFEQQDSLFLALAEAEVRVQARLSASLYLLRQLAVPALLQLRFAAALLEERFDVRDLLPIDPREAS